MQKNALTTTLMRFAKFMGASGISFLIDYGVFALMENVVLAGFGTGQEIISTVVARLVSAPCNFLLNRNFVFKSDQGSRAFVRYVILAVCILASSAIGVELLMTLLRLPDIWAVGVKAVVDTLLYLVSYRVQNKWVFAADQTAPKEVGQQPN